MARLSVLIVIGLQLLVCGTQAEDKVCQPTPTQSRFEVLPGRGWDNLRNVDLGQVFAANYSDCHFSDDGVYFVPVTVQLIPRKASQVQFFSDVYSNFQSYNSLTSASINRAGHGDFDGEVQISGSFSAEFQKVKTTQINTRSMTTRVQLRHTLYTAMQEPNAPLTTSFRDRLLTVAYELEANNTLLAEYLADMIVADYGTHFVSTVDAGAVYASIDFHRTDQSTISDSQMARLKMSAAVNFEKVAGVNSSYGFAHGTNSTKGYYQNLTDSTFITAGGPTLGPGASVNDWVAGIERNLVAIDRSGPPLFYAVNMETLGSLSATMVGQVRQSIQRGVERYYHANTVIGCMERESDNFNMMANIPSKNCKSPRYNHTFGGVFQTCRGDSNLCKEVTVPNPMTGGPSCSKGFRSIHLWSRVYKCRKDCHGWWIFKKCKTPCAVYDLFWCASTDGLASASKSSYLFGGVFNSQMSNPLIGGYGCPPAFYALKMGSSGLKVCLSRDFELGEEHAFEFGGFFSCESGNPYTLLQEKKADTNTVAHYILNQEPSNWPKRCPEGFAQHMADIDGSCEIMYCIRMHAFAQAKRTYVRRPPFTKIPGDMIPNAAPVPNTISFSLAPGSNEQWVRDPQKNTWSFASHGFISDSSSKQPLVIVASVLGSLLGTLCLGFLIAFFILRRRRNYPPLLSGQSNPNYTGDIQDGATERGRAANSDTSV